LHRWSLRRRWLRRWRLDGLGPGQSQRPEQEEGSGYRSVLELHH